MALRFYLPFTSLHRGPTTSGEEWRAELWDDEFVGSAVEVDGDYEGLNIEWEGESDIIGGVMPSSASYRMVINDESEMAIVTALAGAAKGRFKMVVKRAGSSTVYWAGVVHTDQVSYPDAYFPFHLELFATDGIGDLKDIDYADDLGDFYQGEALVIEHLVNIIEKIGMTDVGTWPTNLIRSTANWYSNGMNTTTSPLAQALLMYDRFEGVDREGNNQYWNCYAVLDSLMKCMHCQFFHADGMYHIRQLDSYKDATQKEHYFDATGTLTSTVAAADLDRTVDYATAGGMVKRAVGQYTFLPPLREVCVDYHHKTSNDKGQGQVWNTGDETWHTLPGAVIVDAADETFLKGAIKIRHKSNLVVIPPGSQPYPDHRFRFSVQIRMEDGTTPGSYYYLQRTTNTNVPFYDLQPSEMEWFFEGPDEFKIWARPINDFDNNIEYELSLAFTTPALPVEVSGSKIEMKIDLLGAEKPNGGDVTIDGVTLQGAFTWYTHKVSLLVEDEGGGEDGSNEVERTCATVDNGNTEERVIDTYFGDGPAPFTLSTFRVGTAITTGWKVGNLGTAKPLPQLLAETVLSFRKKPQPVFRATFIHPYIEPWQRFVDDDRAWMATRISLSAFENTWSGDFVLMDADVDGIVNEPPITPDNPTGPTIPGNPPQPPQSPDVRDGFTTFPPFEGLNGGTLPGYVSLAEQSITKLSAAVLASTFNSTHTISVTAVGYSWVTKGDQISIINPITGHRETFTVDATPTPTASSITIKSSETMVKDFPYGSFVKLTPKVAGQVKGWSYLERGFSGTDWEIPGSAGILPTVTNYDDQALRQRVKVWRGGLMLIYDTDTSYDDSFHIQNTDPQKIIFHFACRGENVYLEVR